MYSPGTGGFYRGGASQPGQRPQGMAGRLRSSLDAADRDDALGKVYDINVIKRLPRYMAWVKKYLALAGIGTILRTFTNIAIPFVVAIVTNNYIENLRQPYRAGNSCAGHLARRRGRARL